MSIVRHAEVYKNHSDPDMRYVPDVSPTDIWTDTDTIYIGTEPIATFKPSSERNPRTGALSYGLDVSHLDGTPWKRTAGNWGSMCNAMEPILRTISDEREAQRVAA